MTLWFKIAYQVVDVVILVHTIRGLELRDNHLSGSAVLRVCGPNTAKLECVTTQPYLPYSTVPILHLENGYQPTQCCWQQVGAVGRRCSEGSQDMGLAFVLVFELIGEWHIIIVVSKPDSTENDISLQRHNCPCSRCHSEQSRMWCLIDINKHSGSSTTGC